MSLRRRGARRGALPVLLLLLALVLGACAAGERRPSPRADRLPDVTLQPLVGSTPVDLGELRGPVVVNLWASWCVPCREELPIYARFAEKYEGRVDVLGIDFQETRADAARKLARTSGVRYPLVSDPDGQLRAIGLPMVILVDEDGRIAHREYVEITSLGQLETLVRRHLGVRA